MTLAEEKAEKFVKAFLELGDSVEAVKTFSKSTDPRSLNTLAQKYLDMPLVLQLLLMCQNLVAPESEQ